MPVGFNENPVWIIFSMAFLVALTGAMAPGPLLTYTIIKSASSRRGYLMGIWVIVGHALVESVIVLFLLLGFSYVFEKTAIVRGIGIVGGVILILFGCSIIRDVRKGNISTTFLKNDCSKENAEEAEQRKIGLGNPVLGGIFVSMSNPYWWVWWATIGSAFIVQFDITLRNWPRLIAFFVGHEAGDLAWYLLVSVLVFFGLQHFNRKIYYAILILCGIFMVGFGLFLGISPFFHF